MASTRKTSPAIPAFLRLHTAFLLLTLLLAPQLVATRKHHLEVREDIRPYIALSTFGFYIDGHLDVKLSKLTVSSGQESELFGLSLDKTTIDQMNPYLDSHQNKCILEEPSIMQQNGPILFFMLDLKNGIVRVRCSPEWKNLHIYPDRSFFPMYRGKRQSRDKGISGSTLFMQARNRRDIAPSEHSNEHSLSEEAFNDDDPSYEKPKPVGEIKASSPLGPPAQGAPDQVAAEQSRAESKPNTAVGAEPPPAPVQSGAVIGPALNDIPAAPKLPVDSSSKEFPFQSDGKGSLSQLPVDSGYHSENSYHGSSSLCHDYTLPLFKTTINGQTYYNMSFSMLVASIPDEGLYNLYFHACPNYRVHQPVSFDVDIEENNNGNYLSAGEMPLPALYFMMSLLFFLSGLFWVFILKKSKHNVFKIHYIMAVLVFLKSLSLMFHSINYHFIEIRGEHVETWAILYYIAHLLKGAVLFITIVLIGTGWTFIKHILSDKDKKIFMIVIPLQVLANVAEIIIDESEESDIEFRTWRNIFIFVDLLCCGAILFPIVWSIRHLHEASATDGKAAINLRKLKLFRQFYIMIVCYIYFTRIIVYLLKMTVAFQYAWLDEMFHEMATYVFFVLTGYKFRPASSHPYFSLPEDDRDDDITEVLTESGLTEGLHRTKAQNRNATMVMTTTSGGGTTIIEGNDEERENLLTKRESSHEYD